MKKQNKLKNVILAPFRKAKNFYLRGMEDLAGRVGQGGGFGGPTAQVPTVPRSFSVRSSKGTEDDEDYTELLRSVSKRNAERLRTAGMGVGGPSNGNGTGLGAMRSYSVGIGKIGKIEEDKPCNKFEDVNRAEVAYPRSRRHAVGRGNFAY